MDKKLIAASGREGRLVAARLLTGEDLVEGVMEIIRGSGFKSGNVHVIGAMSKVAVLYPKGMVWKKSPEELKAVMELEGPIQIGYAHGVFGAKQDGGIFMHMHGVFMGKDGKTVCGDPVPGASPVWLTADVTVREFLGIDMKPMLDEELNNEFFHPERISSQGEHSIP